MSRFPSSGRGSTVAALARHYGGASLSVDAVVTAMLLNGTSPVSLTARRLHDQAVEEYAEKKAEEAGTKSRLCRQCKTNTFFIIMYLFYEMSVVSS